MPMSLGKIGEALRREASPKAKLGLMIFFIGLTFIWLGKLGQIAVIPSKLDLQTSQWFLSTVYQGNLAGAAILFLIFTRIGKSYKPGFTAVHLIIYSGMVTVLIVAFVALWLLGAQVELFQKTVILTLTLSFLGFFVAFSGWIFILDPESE